MFSSEGAWLSDTIGAKQVALRTHYWIRRQSQQNDSPRAHDSSSFNQFSQHLDDELGIEDVVNDYEGKMPPP